MSALSNANAISHLIGTAAITRLDDSAECVGCGNTKRYRGKPVESLICCRDCWNRLPKWVRDSYIHQKMRPIGDATHGPTVWQNRISLILQWMRKTPQENERPEATADLSGIRRPLLCVDRPWSEYPIGTKAHSCMGGWWLRTERGWQWNGKHGTFPTPGGEACGKCIELPPEN